MGVWESTVGRADSQVASVRISSYRACRLLLRCASGLVLGVHMVLKLFRAKKAYFVPRPMPLEEDPEPEPLVGWRKGLAVVCQVAAT